MQRMRCLAIACNLNLKTLSPQRYIKVRKPVRKADGKINNNAGKKALNLLLALNSNMGRTNLTRVENVNSLFVTKWNKIIWIDTYALINLTDTSIITVLPWDFSLSLQYWKLLSLAGIRWRPASLTQFGFYRLSYLLVDMRSHPTEPSLCWQFPPYFCQCSGPKFCLQGLLLGVCSAETGQGFTTAPFSAFFRGSLLPSLLIIVPSTKALPFLFSMSNPRKIFWATFS